MAAIEDTYDERYLSGEYDDRFGPFDVAPMDVVIATNLIIDRAIARAGIIRPERKLDLKKFSASLSDLAEIENSDIFYKEIIQRLFKFRDLPEQLSEEKIAINILDYGCGAARHFHVYRQVAEQLQQHNVLLNLFFYDISQGGLAVAEHKIKQFGYERSEDENVLISDLGKAVFVHCDKPDNPHVNTAKSREWLSGTYSKVGTELQIAGHLYGGVDWTFDAYKEQGSNVEQERPFDLAFSFFGVNSHNIDFMERAINIRVMQQLTRHKVLYSVGGDGFGSDPSLDKTHHPEGDYYTYKVNGATLPYKVFDSSQLHKEMLAMGVNSCDMYEIPASIKRPMHCSGSAVEALEEFRNAVSTNVIEIDPTYIYCGFDPLQRERVFDSPGSFQVGATVSR